MPNNGGPVSGSQSDAAGTQDTDSPSPPASALPDDQWETNNRLHRAGAKLKRFYWECLYTPEDEVLLQLAGDEYDLYDFLESKYAAPRHRTESRERVTPELSSVNIWIHPLNHIRNSYHLGHQAKDRRLLSIFDVLRFGYLRQELGHTLKFAA
ncbi:hypothetical protein ARMGADRAFT_1032184 [Armillaria gallica]|uniref:Uncharacterized protein n=1 Tax=Armillaria gallica TaxID=47427 RepID=A0A2H3DGP0_ARMGA|nr:hypothetical protein ARMGADRAFT_1032184 [Armillaria gallica]